MQDVAARVCIAAIQQPILKLMDRPTVKIVGNHGHGGANCFEGIIIFTVSANLVKAVKILLLENLLLHIRAKNPELI